MTQQQTTNDNILKEANERNNSEATAGHHDEECSTVSVSVGDVEERPIELTEVETTVNSEIKCQEPRMELGHEFENWRGMAQPNPGRKRRNTYLNPQSDWCAISLSHERKVLKLGLLKNGHRPELKPVKIGNENYVLANTCAFDSFVQILCVAYCDSDNVRNLFGKLDIRLADLVRSVVTNGVTMSAYKMRAEILRQIFDTEVLPHGLGRINATCSVSSLVNEVWLPEVFTEISECSSAVCPSKVRTNNFKILTVQLQKSEFMTHLQYCMQRTLCHRSIKCCTPITEYNDEMTTDDYLIDKTVSDWPICVGKRCISTAVCGEFLFIEVIQPDVSVAVAVEAKLATLPVILNIDKQFRVRGVIGFFGGKSVNSVGHYIAYCRRNDASWQTFDDLKNSSVKFRGDPGIRIHLLIYST